MSATEKVVLDAEGIQRALTRIAHEILEFHNGTQDLTLVGIRTRGVHLAERLQKQIQAIENVTLPLGLLDITLYRDDLREIGPRPEVRQTEIPFNITGQKVILVDDVLYTGRTVRAALDALTDYGRPLLIQLAVLIDRGHRELPIKADYVGKNIPTSQEEEVILHLREKDNTDDVIVKGRAE
jgi:pyrimidine operon attenuation protein / uracil phosphoribosyltransferase